MNSTSLLWKKFLWLFSAGAIDSGSAGCMTKFGYIFSTNSQASKSRHTPTRCFSNSYRSRDDHLTIQDYLKTNKECGRTRHFSSAQSGRHVRNVFATTWRSSCSATASVLSRYLGNMSEHRHSNTDPACGEYPSRWQCLLRLQSGPPPDGFKSINYARGARRC